MKKILITSSVFILFLCSCKKDNNTPKPACSKTVADIAGTYSIVKVEAGPTEPSIDITNTELKPCQRDDKIGLKADGTASYQDVGTVCSPDGAASGTWLLGADNKVTVNVGSIVIGNAEIVTFDCTTLVLLYNGTVSGIPLKFRITIKK